MTFTLMIMISICVLNAQQEIKLYKNGPAESNGIKKHESMLRSDFVINIRNPRMYFYPAAKEKSIGSSVLICPGGGYVGVSVIKEGEEIAKWFNDLGVTAFVLYYRMPNGHSDIPLKDAQTALMIIKKGAKEWNLDEHKIGVMGFSAGGHLASTVGTHFTKNNRPDFMILAYPVITMNKKLTHTGSRENLIGKDPNEKLVKFYSSELHVEKNTPPTFMVVATDDDVVPVENSYMFYKALQAKNVPAEIHTFPKGGHGFGMRKRGLEVDNWPDFLKKWLQTNKLIN